MLGLGSSREAAVGELLVLHEHEVPQLGVALVLVGGAEQALTLGVAGGPLAVEDVDLEQGPQGPVSPIAQKFSLAGRR
jgi:hypothetical protein